MMREIWKEIPGKIRYLLFFILGIIIALLFTLTACTKLTNALKDYKDDNIVEEIGEQVIEHFTGVDIDITPSSPENNE